MTEAELQDAINATWRRMVEFPFSQVCKHLAACMLFDELEKRGANLNKKLVEAVVNADDCSALEFTDYRAGETQ